MNPEMDAWSRRCTFPYLHGVYLAINAIPDAYLLVDAPSCAFQKAEQVFGSHDLMSDLLDTSSRHRIVNTGLHVDNVVDANRERCVRTMADMVAAPFVGALFYTAFPMAVVIGTPYDNWYAAVPGIDRKLVVPVPGLSLEADWFRGYAETLSALARRIPLAAGKPDPDKVAIVGYFMDRTEEDHLGNVRELRRLLGALGLDVVSIWLDGSPTVGLARAGEAGTILSFPHGRQAASVLAARTGARLLECELPFGLDATERWLRGVAAAFGREDAAAALIKDETAFCLSRLKWLVPRRLVHRRWAFGGDPVLMPGLCEIATVVGARVDLLVSWTIHAPTWEGVRPPPIDVLYNQGMSGLHRLLVSVATEVDLFIGNSEFLRMEILPEGPAFMEFGFPSLMHHAISDDPYLGYRGFSRFLNRVADQYLDWDHPE